MDYKFCYSNVPNVSNSKVISTTLKVHMQQNGKLKFYARKLQNYTKFKFCKVPSSQGL